MLFKKPLESTQIVSRILFGAKHFLGSYLQVMCWAQLMKGKEKMHQMILKVA